MRAAARLFAIVLRTSRSTLSDPCSRIYFPSMPKEEQIVMEGTVTQVLPGTMFRVDLAGQRNVLAPYLGQNAQALHPHRSRRQSLGGAFALRSYQGADHLSRAIGRRTPLQ